MAFFPQDNLHHMDTFSTDEVVSSVISSHFSSSAVDRKRSWTAIDLEELLESCSTDDTSSAKQSLADGSDMLFFDSESEESKNGKKAKVEWTSDLHKKFVEAVENLGTEKAVPSRILERMGVQGDGLTRQNIASHLQKYRHRARGRTTTNAAVAAAAVKAQATVATPLVPSFVPGVPTNSNIGVAPSPMLIAPGSRPQAGLPQSQTQPWMHPMQVWGPWPQGAIIYNHIGQPVMPSSSVAASAFCQAVGCQSGPSSDAVQKAIRDVLSRPKAKAPLGLTLDTSKLLEKLQKMPELLSVPLGPAAA
eukprot:scaffold445455_cov47-Prasinocladus_malaysianus.AAC.2